MLFRSTTALFLAGGSGITAYFSFGVKGWTAPADLAAQLPGKIPGALGLYLLLAAVLGTGARSLGYPVQRYLAGFTVLYLLAIAVLIVSAHSAAKSAQLEGPLVALLIGLVIGNAARLPAWFNEALRTLRDRRASCRERV